MLICNNCAQPNPDHATQCYHCCMVGDFSYRETEQKEPEKGEPTTEPYQKELPTCINCAATISEEDHRCGYCHFPVSKPSGTRTVIQHTSLKVWRKTA